MEEQDDADLIAEIEERRPLHGQGTSAIERARAVGAKGPLTFAGAGMYGIVLCDEKGRAYKVGRAVDSFHRAALEEEYEWLRAANRVHDVAPHVASVFGWYPKECVLVRECVDGRPGGWSHESKLFDLHQRIRASMMPHGWSAPEFKADSYVIRERDGRPILVDASMAVRFGRVLLDYAKDIVAGKRTDHDPPSDVARALQSEVSDGRLTQDEVAPIEQKLAAMPRSNPTRGRTMPTAATATKGGFAKYIRKELDTADRMKQRDTILALKKSIAAIQADRKEALRGVRTACQIAIDDAKKRAARLRRWATSTVEKAEGECSANKKEIEASKLPDEEKARRLLRDERDLQALLRSAERNLSAKSKTKRTAKEAMQESDDDVEREIEPHLLPLWRRVKKTIKAKPGMSRYEAFLHYVEENPDEALTAIEDAAPDEDEFQAAQRAYYEEQERKANPAKPSPTGLVAKRAANFRDTGNYEVQTGSKLVLMFRDAENGWWYEHGPGHYSERVIGFTKEEALERLLSKYGLPTGARAAARETLTWTSTVDKGHTHTLTIPIGDMEGDVSRGYETSLENGHTHRVALTKCALHGILRDEESDVTTTRDMGHNHGFILEARSGVRSGGRQGNPTRRSNPARRVLVMRGKFVDNQSVATDENGGRIEGTTLDFDLFHEDTGKLARDGEYAGPGSLDRHDDGKLYLTLGDPMRQATLVSYVVGDATPESMQQRTWVLKGFDAKKAISEAASRNLTSDQWGWYVEGFEQKHKRKPSWAPKIKRHDNPAPSRKSSKRDDGIMIKGDEVSFILVGEGTPDERELKGYKRRKSFGKGPQDYLTDTVLIHDPTGKAYRECDVYIVRRLSNGSGAKNCSTEVDSKTKNYYPGMEIDCGVPLEKPAGPWQRVGQIDGIRYRRWWDEHGNGEYRFVPFEHPFDPAVTLYRCGNAFRVRLPDRCILDERGFVHP